MKIKPLHIYLILVTAAVIFLIVVSQNNNQKVPQNISTSGMPEDEVHKGLQNPLGNPSGGNVSAEFKQRMEMMKQNIEENPTDTALIKEYADLLSASHKEKESIDYYQRILDTDPNRSDIYFQLTFVYYNLKDFENAKIVTEKVVLLDPQNHEAFYNLGALNAAQGNKEKAKEIWQNLINKFPDSPSAKLAEESYKKL